MAASQIDTFSFTDEFQERRYRALIEEFRCPKCLNTNLAGSDAPIARDLRKVVYRLVVNQGMSDQEVRDYLHARYGDFILYDPPFNSKTWYIWLVPVALGVLAMFVLLRLVRGARSSTTVLIHSSRSGFGKSWAILRGRQTADHDVRLFCIGAFGVAFCHGTSVFALSAEGRWAIF